jgi:putative tryptophan/tyrosine transport system substrate-binding protein
MTAKGLLAVATRRHWLATGMAWPAIAWLDALHAQPNPPVVIGWLSTDTRRGPDEFNDSMAALGWKIGTQYVLEQRHADGRVERLPALAQELAALKPAIIVAAPSRAARAAMVAAPTTPIVLAFGDPLSTGLVTSLARPGGLVTGLSNVSSELNLKVVELLVEARPKLQRVGFLADATSYARDANVGHVHRAAERFRFEAVIVDMAKPEDIEPAMAQLAKARVQALVILTSAWFAPHFPKIIESALVQRWPVAGTQWGISYRGGLFSFGIDSIALVRRSAHYVDRILKGAKPGDLPIEQPTTFELVLNLKTAKALGIVIPPSMRLRATRVIE